MLRKLGRTKTIKQDQEGLEVPPGQYVTEKFPVLTFGPTPDIDPATWRFKIFGLVEKEVELDWEQFTGLTQWSRLENTWEGIPFSEVARLARPRPEASHVMVHCFGGYTTNLPLDVVSDDDVLFAYRHDGEPLAPAHGGPLRLVVPKRYGWKSAKWVSSVEFMDKDAPGFWEVRGYHMEGDPWKEERFWSELN